MGCGGGVDVVGVEATRFWGIGLLSSLLVGATAGLVVSEAGALTRRHFAQCASRHHSVEALQGVQAESHHHSAVSYLLLSSHSLRPFHSFCWPLHGVLEAGGTLYGKFGL